MISYENGLKLRNEDGQHGSALKNSISRDALNSSPYRSVSPNTHHNQSTNGPIYTNDAVCSGLKSMSVSRDESEEEPKTPEEQIFGFPEDMPSLASTQTSTLSYSSDYMNAITPNSEVSSTSTQKVRSVRRKPVPKPCFYDESPIPPLRLKGLKKGALKQSNPELCGFCDMPLNATFYSETAVRMECGHVAHRECRDNLILISKEYGDELPTCTVCDGSISIQTMSPMVSKASELFEPERQTPVSAHEPAILFNSPTFSKPAMSTQRKLASSQSASSMLSQILSPDNQRISQRPLLKHQRSRRSLKDAMNTRMSTTPISASDSLSNPDSPAASIYSLSSETGRSSMRSLNSAHETNIHMADDKQEHSSAGLYHKILEDIPSYCESKAVTDSDDSPLLVVSGYAAPSQALSHSVKTSQVALWIQAPNTVRISDSFDIDNLEMERSYRSSAKDVQYGISIKRELEQSKYRGKSLASEKLGLLRLTSEVGVTSPDRKQLNWPVVNAYLFEKTLVLVTVDPFRIRAVLDAPNAISSANIGPDDPTIVSLESNSSLLPSLLFHTKSPAEAYMWKMALADPTAQFPLHPTNYEIETGDLDAKILSSGHFPKAFYNDPADIVLCMPYKFATVNLTVQQDIMDSLKLLKHNDRLSIVLFANNSVQKVISLQNKFWTGWPQVLDDLKIAKDKQIPSYRSQNSCRSRTLKTFEDVLDKVAYILTNRDTESSTASAIIVSDDDRKLGQIPKYFEQKQVPLHTIGVSENHDALTLSTMARTTGGSYVYAGHAEELGPLLRNLMHGETQYVAREVVVKLRSRLGAEITDYMQINLDGTENPRMLDPATRTTEWRLGKMRRGDVRSLVFTVRGDLPENQPLVQVSVDTHAISKRKPDMVSLRIDAPHCDELKGGSQQFMSCMLNTENVLGASFGIFEEVLAALILDNNRRAFQALSSGCQLARDYLDGANTKPRIVNSACRQIVEALNHLFDQQCDAIIEHKLLTKNFVLESLQRLWILSARRSLASRDCVELIFQC